MSQHTFRSSRLTEGWTRWTALVVLVGLTFITPSALASGVAPAVSTANAGYQPSDCGGALVPPSHPTINIASDSDWTAANGVTAGDGSASNPYVIKCLSIPVPGKGAGLSVGGTLKSFSVSDLQIASAPGGIGSVGMTIGSLRGGHARIANNSISFVGTCVSLSADAEVTGNRCTDATGDGFTIGGGGTPAAPAAAVVAGNVSDRNRGNGFYLTGNAVAHDNTSTANANGVLLLGLNTVDHNILSNNRGAGVEMSSATASIISNNTITGNGSSGIVSDPSNVNGFFSWSSRIFGNHVGYSPYGIVFTGIATGHQVWDTDWIDGHQSIVDSADQNTLVDAGSSKQAAAGQTVLFDDYLARITIGNTGAPPLLKRTPNGSDLGTFAYVEEVRPAVETSLSWDFGAGSGCDPVTVTDPGQGQGPVRPVLCMYANAGSYTATLTVRGLDTNNQPVVLSDTVQITIL